MATLEELATLDGLAELETRQIVTTIERDGIVWYRFAHPMLAAAAAQQLTPTRRRRVADALIAAPVSGTDPLRRALWELRRQRRARRRGPAGGAVARVSSPSRRWRSGSPSGPCCTTRLRCSALLLADVHAELGEIGAARDAQRLALTNVRADDDLLLVRLNQVSLTAFSDRRPDVALELLAGTRAELDRSVRGRDRLDGRAADGLLRSPRGGAGAGRARARHPPGADQRDPCVERPRHGVGDE